MIKRLVLPILVVAVTYASLLFMIGSSAWVHVDIPSFILVPLAPLVYMAFSYGFAGFGEAFRSPFSAAASPKDLRLSLAFFEDLGKAIWCFGAIGSGTGFIEVLRNLTDRTKLGPNLAVALLTVLYAATFSAMLVLPFLANARRRLAGLGAAEAGA